VAVVNDQPGAGLPARLNAMTRDGRFFFDGVHWQVVPLPPELTAGQGRIAPELMWVLVCVAALVGGAIVFEILVRVGMAITHG
jgi:hypothetical protein